MTAEAIVTIHVLSRGAYYGTPSTRPTLLATVYRCGGDSLPMRKQP